VALTLRNENDTRPRFEYYPVNSSTLRTVFVEDFPFIMGRGECTQLQIKSTSVSREHAQLTKTSVGYRISDLGSTNGTAINGQPITDAPLEDGDSISIAETELTFLCSASGRMERMATHALPDKRKIEPSLELANAVLASRALGEALLWQAIPLSRTSVIDYQSGTEQTTIVSVDEPLASRLHVSDTSDRCSTASRIQQLAWQLAAEHADEISPVDSLLMRVELQSSLDDRLCDALDQAFECITGNQSLGFVFPWEWAVQSPASLALCTELRTLGAGLAFDRFSGGATCIDDMELSPPDFLLLAPTFARGISSHPRRMKQLETIASKCEAADIQIVLPAGLAEEDYQAGNDLGLNLIVKRNSTPMDIRKSDPVVASV